MTSSNSTSAPPPAGPAHDASAAPAAKGTESAPATPPQEPAASPRTRVIKRYSNRKLYDTVDSRYVTLPQIAELVRRGEDVHIIDNNSKDDLTSVTLAQILYEEERRQSRALPLGALRELIHTSGEKLMTSLREGPMGKLIGRSSADEKPEEEVVPVESEVPVEGAAGASTTQRFQGLVEQSRGAIEDWQRRVDERVRTLLEAFSPTHQLNALQAEVRRLASRIEELEKNLGRRTKGEDGTGGRE